MWSLKDPRLKLDCPYLSYKFRLVTLSSWDCGLLIMILPYGPDVRITGRNRMKTPSPAPAEWEGLKKHESLLPSPASSERGSHIKTLEFLATFKTLRFS